MTSGVGRKWGEKIRAKETLVESEATITNGMSKVRHRAFGHSASAQHQIIQYGTKSYLFETLLIGYCYAEQGGLKLVASAAQGWNKRHQATTHIPQKPLWSALS